MGTLRIVMRLDWIEKAVHRYEDCNRNTLTWILDRPTLGGFLNTKVSALTGNNYDHTSGLRGPGFTYGWIQGRGLEALVTFAKYYREIDPSLSRRLADQSQLLYQRLRGLYSRDGHAYFLYDAAMRPVQKNSEGVELQGAASSIYSYSDAFVAKGLFAAACDFDPAQSAHYLNYLQNVVDAITGNRFQMDESYKISAENAGGEPDDFGPKMIMLGAAGVLHRAGRSEDAAFADKFIDYILKHHFDETSGLLLNTPGQDICNVGHGIEFCGFAFEHLRLCPDDRRVATLVSVLVRSLELGLQGPGIALSLSAKSGEALSPYYPWWPMPEAIRACALGLKLTGDPRLLGLWQRADDAFFTNYWQASQRFAHQTLTVDGPVDFVPATPDLDPGYHTGLSLLAAIKAMEG